MGLLLLRRTGTLAISVATTSWQKMLDGVSSGMVLESIRHPGARIYTETEVAGRCGACRMCGG